MEKQRLRLDVLYAFAQAAVQAVAAYIRQRLATKHGLDVPDPGEEGQP